MNVKNTEMINKVIDSDLEKRDILESEIPKDVLDILLIDRTTRKNILWMTDSYEHLESTFDIKMGYTRSNLRTMRQFYLMFPICHAVSGKLTWTHYRTLITVENEAARQYYFEEAVKSKWSVRDLQRQIETQFYQRLIANHVDLSSAGKLVKRGKVEARDIVRSPAILEFAGISPAEYKEKDLQTGLVKHLSKFMLELGRGFALVREQCPIQIGSETYHCDLLFYNFIARCFVLIDLKVGKVTPQDIGQMQLYKHYYEREMMNPGDNPPIGIVLGSDKGSDLVRYTLPLHNKRIFAAKYKLHLPSEQELITELRRERTAIKDAQLVTKLNTGEIRRIKKSASATAKSV